jgi:hypothetical protein
MLGQASNERQLWNGLLVEPRMHLVGLFVSSSSTLHFKVFSQIDSCREDFGFAETVSASAVASLTAELFTSRTCRSIRLDATCATAEDL